MRSTDASSGYANNKSAPPMMLLTIVPPIRPAAIAQAIVVVIAIALYGSACFAVEPTALRGPEGGEVRGLIIGIDAYRYVRPLKGAVADARDIEAALRKMGTKDVTTLIDAQADRDSVLKIFDQLIARTRPGDIVLLSIAGHGAQEPERVKGSQPDGMEDVFLLPGFQPSATGSRQRILGQEFNHFIKQFEARGARVLFVADTCHGGGMVRSLDPRAEEMSFRQVQTYRLAVDDLKPVSTSTDALLTELDFENAAFLAAVDRRTKAPEVSIPGIPGLRGALTYAVARAIEGNADANADGKITLKELFTNVRQVVYQLSNQRQNIVTMTSPKRDLNTDVVFQLTRAVTMLETVPQAPKASTGSASAPIATPGLKGRPVKIASLDGKSTQLSDLKMRTAPFEIVAPVDNPDLIWDPDSHDVLAWGDVIAYRIDKNDLTSVIDRAAAVRELKQMATAAPQVVRVVPDDALHHNQSIVDIAVGDVAGRALILFNIAGDGTIQPLYPIGSDPPIVLSDEYRLPVRVREPFGADQMVAITSQQRMTALEQVLMQFNGRRSAVQVLQMVERYAPADARIGVTGLFTAP
jgi:hypothetical protein